MIAGFILSLIILFSVFISFASANKFNEVVKSTEPYVTKMFGNNDAFDEFVISIFRKR